MTKYRATKAFTVRIEPGTLFSGSLKELLKVLLDAGAVEKAEEDKHDGK